MSAARVGVMSVMSDVIVRCSFMKELVMSAARVGVMSVMSDVIVR